MGIILKIAEALDNKQMRSQGKKASENSQLNNAIKDTISDKVQDKISDTVFRVIKKVFRSIGRVIASMFKTIFHHDGLNVDWSSIGDEKKKSDPFYFDHLHDTGTKGDLARQYH
jgi:hypothetical protein